jgi:Family of unknown function (DUF6049)
VTGGKTPSRVWPQTASATLLAISVLAISVLPILSPMPAATALATVAARAPVVATIPPLTVSVTTITPTVAVPQAPITIKGSVRNSSGVAITSPVARALLGQRPLTSRQAVADWATSTGQQLMDEAAQTSLGKTLAPGAVTAFSLTIPANAIGHDQAFDVLPLRVEAVATTPAGSQASGDVNTYLPTQATIKAFEPLSIAWLVPLTLDPDPALQGMASPTRTAAWTKAIGPGSRLDQLIQGTTNANVTWAIDPAILGPSLSFPAVDAAAQSAPTPSQSLAPGGVSTPDPVTAMTTALAQRLKAAAPGHTLWSLPYADPDFAALLPLTSGDQSLTAFISHPSTLDVAVGPARADIAWPVTGTLTPQIQADLRRAFASPGLTAAVTSASTVTSRNGSASEASRKSSSGLPLLAYDEPLSRTVAQTSSKANGTITIQRFLADSMALLGERPGTRNRSVLIAEPRTFAGDPTVLRSLFAAVDKAPWLVPATTGQLLAASEKLAPENPGSDTTGTSGTATSPSANQPDPLSPGTSPLTSYQLANLPDTMSSISGIASMLGNGPAFASTWTDAQVQQLSARWRNHPEAITAIDAATNAAINTVSSSVRVAPSSVNFFADRGVMQVTVVNDLGVPIHDVHLTLTPAQPRLRIERQPGPLKIGANARANVPLQVTSIAAGLVKVEAVLTTQNGTPLGQNATVNVRVQPPGSWVYWVLGGMAFIVLVLGTQRSLRRGSTRASVPDAQEPPLDD